MIYNVLNNSVSHIVIFLTDKQCIINIFVFYYNEFKTFYFVLTKHYVTVAILNTN